ncbi:MAG: VWA domain-containing protein, partial [Chloroflexota bacterium]
PMLTLQLLNPWALALLVLLPLAGWIASRGGVHMPRDRAWFSLGLRLLVLALLALALAMPRVLRTANRLSTVFLVDVSDSITPDQVNAELGWIRSALRAQGPRDQAGVVLFGANAVVEQPLSRLTSLPRFASTVQRGHTDIAAAVRLGLGLLPNTTARRLVLLSDGNENLEQSLDEARIAGAAGVQLDVVPIAKNQDPEVYIKQVVAPDSLREGETFALTVTVVSNVATSAELRLLTDGQVSSQEAVQIHLGTNSFVFNHQPLPGGPHVFQAIVQPGEDTVSRNNQASAFTNVAGKPKVLIIDGDPGDSTALAAALRSQGMQVDLSTPSGLPADLPTLRAYDTVVLSNVSADRLTAAQLQNLQTYVRDLGGGLLVVGGNTSYGTGNYHNTPLETVLPVTSEVAPREDLPSTAVFFIIESLENNLGIDISREAAKSAINALTALDQVGVSDGTQPVAIPLQQVSNKAALLS